MNPDEIGLPPRRPQPPPSSPSAPPAPSPSQSSQPSISKTKPMAQNSKGIFRNFYKFFLFGALIDCHRQGKETAPLLEQSASFFFSGFIGTSFIFTGITGKLLISTTIPIIDIPSNVGSYAGLIPNSMFRTAVAIVDDNPGFGLRGKEVEDFQVKQADTLEFKANE